MHANNNIKDWQFFQYARRRRKCYQTIELFHIYTQNTESYFSRVIRHRQTHHRRQFHKPNL